ncbi:hypothetical protein AB0E00_35610 [Streptomyces sp. NPDC048110]|uniref:hypothetical protein n=1 Tax=Streptomyces sp. NPDC048110 TaxID=3155483 RepID=UPI0033D51AD1
MADLNAVRVPTVGLADVAAAAVAAAPGGDTAPVGPGLFLYVANGGAGSVTVTITTTGTVKGLAISDGVLTVAAGDHGLVALTGVYRGVNGRAALTYDDATSVTVAAFELES